jgi:AcrR family transcriptional regulator
VPRQPSGTRSLIMNTAMRMFIERGYDKTSLREIAEEVGVTKAALYYHFRTKDDIVRAAFADYWAQMEDLINWVREQPKGEHRSEQVVDRLLDILSGEAAQVLQFGQANPTVMSRDSHQSDFVDAMPRLISALAGGEASAERQLRALLSFGALLMGNVESDQMALSGTRSQRREASRRIALELLEPLNR